MARPSATRRLLPALLLLTNCAFAQLLAEPDDVDAIRQAFDTAASATRLRCKVHPVQPELTYAFRFQAGYTVDVPLNQYRGSGHGFTTYLRVTPEGKDPTYLSKMEALPVVPDTRAEAELAGNFATGEGAYRVELLLQDDRHRVCRGAWPIQAKLSTAEHQLNVPTPTGAVQELSAGAWSPPTNPDRSTNRQTHDPLACGLAGFDPGEVAARGSRPPGGFPLVPDAAIAGQLGALDRLQSRSASRALSQRRIRGGPDGRSGLGDEPDGTGEGGLPHSAAPRPSHRPAASIAARRLAGRRASGRRPGAGAANRCADS